MKKQEVFNKIYAHALTMETAAVSSGNSNKCMYRSSNGPCLIGALIKDEFYKPELEDCRPYDDIVKEALISSGIQIRNSSDTIFLDVVQQAHDHVSNFSGFKARMLERLEQVAYNYNLKVPKVTA